MVIETTRLIIRTASRDEMIRFIEKQTDEILIKNTDSEVATAIRTAVVLIFA